MPPATLLERLDHCLDVLKQSAATGDERHQTLRSTSMRWNAYSPVASSMPFLAQGDLPTARRLLTDCIRIRQRLGMQQPLVLALDVVADLLIAEGQPAAAPLVLGAAVVLRQVLGTAPSPVEASQITATITSTLAQISQVAFDAAYQAGTTALLTAVLDELLSD